MIAARITPQKFDGIGTSSGRSGQDAWEGSFRAPGAGAVEALQPRKADSMFDYIPSNTTNDDLIRAHGRCGDPLVEELCGRLEYAVGADAEIEEAIAEAKREAEEAANAPCCDCERAQEKIDELQDRIADMVSDAAHQDQRIAEFAEENRRFIEEIKRLKNGNQNHA